MPVTKAAVFFHPLKKNQQKTKTNTTQNYKQNQTTKENPKKQNHQNPSLKLCLFSL